MANKRFNQQPIEEEDNRAGFESRYRYQQYNHISANIGLYRLIFTEISVLEGPNPNT